MLRRVRELLSTLKYLIKGVKEKIKRIIKRLSITY